MNIEGFEEGGVVAIERQVVEPHTEVTESIYSGLEALVEHADYHDDESDLKMTRT